MSHIHKLWYSDDETDDFDQAEANRQTASLAGLMIALVLVVVGLFLIRELHATAVLEDCLLSGSVTCQVYPVH